MNTVCFSKPMLVVNRRCCSNSRVMCAKCAKTALNAATRFVANLPPKGDVDALELGKLLGIDIEPAQDPAGFTQALLAAIDDLRAKLTGGGEVEPMMDEEEPVMAANYRLTEVEQADVLDLDAARRKYDPVPKRNAPTLNRRSKDEPIPNMFERLQPWER